MLYFSKNLSRLSLVLLTLHFVTTAAWAQSDGVWPQFRGTNGTGSTDSALPVTWSEENFKWQTELPGKGWSSPVYVDGKAWMTAAIDGKATREEINKKLENVDFPQIKTAAASVEFFAICVDLDSGEILHNISLGQTDDPQPINPMNSYASPTPAIADGKVICHFGAYGTWCLNAESGETIWKTEFVIQHSVGPGSSPIIVDSKVVLVCDGMDQQFVAAVDLQTGQQVWKTNRPPIKASNGEFRKAYCTPIVREINQRQQIIVTGADWICSYDPANGEEIWRLNYGRGYSITGMPAMVDDLVIFVTGYDVNQLVAFEPTGNGELDKTVVKWKNRGAPTMASVVVRDNVIYSANDRGILAATNATDGSLIKRIRTIGNLSASPLLADGKLYVANRDGQMVVVSCDEELEVLHEYDFGASIMASPCPIDGDLLVRTEEKLIRISKD